MDSITLRLLLRENDIQLRRWWRWGEVRLLGPTLIKITSVSWDKVNHPLCSSSQDRLRILKPVEGRRLSIMSMYIYYRLLLNISEVRNRLCSFTLCLIVFIAGNEVQPVIGSDQMWISSYSLALYGSRLLCKLVHKIHKQSICSRASLWGYNRH